MIPTYWCLHLWVNLSLEFGWDLWVRPGWWAVASVLGMWLCCLLRWHASKKQAAMLERPLSRSSELTLARSQLGMRLTVFRWESSSGWHLGCVLLGGSPGFRYRCVWLPFSFLLPSFLSSLSFPSSFLSSNCIFFIVYNRFLPNSLKSSKISLDVNTW